MEKQLRFLFATSESDSETFYKDENGQFYSRRYGLPMAQVSEKWARSQAWLQANRTGKFVHLQYVVEGDWIPKLGNPEAQEFIVSQMLK